MTPNGAGELLRLRLQSLLARGLAAPEVARRVGLAAASEVWGGDAPRASPAWYVWLRDHPGAWQLELAGAERLPGDGERVVGRLTVRHYPAPGGALLAAFDPEEQAAARAWLDATGTPRIADASRIRDHLFTVGTIDWASDAEGHASLLAVASQDRLRARAGGRLVRDVPGWSLAAPIFSLLAGLHAQLDRRAAFRLVVARAPGFEVVRDGGAVAFRDAVDVVHGEASLLLAPPGACRGAGAALLLATRDPDAAVVLDELLVEERGPRAAAGDPRLPLSVSPAWFGGEAHFERPTCAC